MGIRYGVVIRNLTIGIVLLFGMGMAYALLGSEMQLTNNTTGDIFPTFNSDASKIAWGGPSNGIWTMDFDGTNKFQLTSGSSTWPTGTGVDTSPDYRHDDLKIAFSSRNPTGSGSEIFTINADGMGIQQITFRATVPVASSPSYNQDGTKLVHSRGVGAGGDIWVMDAANGANPAQLTTLGANFQPDYNPAGTKITFWSDRAGGSVPSHIFIMNDDGTGQTQLTTTGSPILGNIAPVFSADGTQILFTCFPNLCLMDADGSNLMQITSDSNAREITGALALDGSTITFSRDQISPQQDSEIWTAVIQATPTGGVAVGGELIPLDSTMVLVAGTHSVAAWMIPVIVSAIGIGIVIARKF